MLRGHRRWLTGLYFDGPGDGAGLTNLNAGQLATGTLADARLSANVALLNANQTFTMTGDVGADTNMGNGTSTGSGVTAQHAYASPGDYEAVLTVNTDKNGNEVPTAMIVSPITASLRISPAGPRKCRASEIR